MSIPLACEYCGAVFYADDEDAKCPCQGGPLTPRRIDTSNEVRVDPAFVLDELAPGVRGYTVEHHGELWIPLVVADHPGQGDVSRYLDSLPHDRTVRFPCVINDILRAALARRGFVAADEWSEEHAQFVEVYTRSAPEVTRSDPK